jgi:hypothetical protein
MDARYPIGTFDKSLAPDRETAIGAIEGLPSELKAALADLPPGGLDKPYRDGGWTARQVVHHLADSHMNSQLRFRFALTEENPTITPYDESAWARLADASGGDIQTSLAIIEGIHTRWTILLRSLTEEQWKRTLVHPETGAWDLERLAGLYAWHGRHHVAHLRLIR